MFSYLIGISQNNTLPLRYLTSNSYLSVFFVYLTVSFNSTAVTTRRSSTGREIGNPTRQNPVQVPATKAGVPPAAQQPNPTFTLSPALATRGIIDYNTRSGERIYASATKELDVNKYDGEAQGLMAFLELLEDRAMNFGWDVSIMMIPIEGQAPKNLLTEYGTITLEQIRLHEESYLATQTREAQDSNLLYECIMNSISVECKAKLTIWKQEYRCQQHLSGNLLLKVLIRECHLDTNATVRGNMQSTQCPGHLSANSGL